MDSDDRLFKVLDHMSVDQLGRIEPLKAERNIGWSLFGVGTCPLGQALGGGVYWNGMPNSRHVADQMLGLGTDDKVPDDIRPLYEEVCEDAHAFIVGWDRFYISREDLRDHVVARLKAKEVLHER